MDVRDAVESAKMYVAETFEDEPIHNIGLEEIEFDHAQGIWSVTIGFAREWRESESVMRVRNPRGRDDDRQGTATD